jgi:hypothetical protein
VDTQIRLAERQGLLTGRGLSPVAVKAIYLRLMQDTHDEVEHQDRSLRQAMLGSGHYEFTDLFPDMATEADSDEAIAADLEKGEDTLLDFSQAEYDPEEAAREVEELLSQMSSGTVTGAELNGGLDW